MRKILSLVAVLVLSSVLAFAQTRPVTGQVKDEKGESVPFASVTIKGTTRGATTDANGNFKLDVKSGDVLVVTAAGSAPREIPVGSLSEITVVLEKNGNLREVVVTALGVAKQPKELGYSVAKIKNSELTQGRVTNLQNGLVGKVSGLNVTTTNNGVFADTRITLRGIRSLTGNNQPLLVVDGSPMSLSFIGSINPNDVESVNILKGANSATLYGPEGVNGVIVVTTKKGGNGRKPQVSFSNSTLWESISFMPDQQGRFGSGSSFDAKGDGIYDPIENQSWGDEFDGSTRIIGRPDADGNEQLVKYSFIPGEKKRFFNTGLTIQNDLSLSSGDDKSNFYLSAQDVTVKGVMPGDKSRRSTLRMNNGRTYGIMKISTNLAYTLGTFDVTSNGGSVYDNVINSPGQIPLSTYSNLNDNWSNQNHFYNDYYPNPYATIFNFRNEGRKDDVFGNMEINLKPFKWLNILERLSYTYSNSYNKNFNRAIIYSDYAQHNGRSISGSGNKPASVGDGSNVSNRVTNELVATVDKSYGDFNFKVLAGHVVRQTRQKFINVSGGNLVIPTLYNVGNRTGEPGVGEGNFKSRLMSVFGSVSIGYKDWAFLEVTGRNDWDSRLPLNNNSYFYPGANLAISLTDAIKSLGESNWLNYAKLKAAYAKTGNVNVGIYSLESTFFQGGGFPYGSLPGFTSNNVIANNTIRPETVESFEVGAELTMFNNRVSLEAAYYFQNNNDQVIGVNISQATGYVQADLNAANFENKGIEVDLKLTPLLNFGKFTWNAGANFTLSDTKIKSLYQGLNELPAGNTSFGIVGYPAYVHKLIDWLRDSATGKVIIDPASGYPTQNPAQTIFGRTLPKYIVGISTDLNYKGFSLRMVAEYRGGNYIYNAIGSSLGFTGIDRLSALNARQRFVFPNSVYQDASGKYVDNTNIVVNNAHYDFLQAGRFRNTQTNYYTSAAFWKLREVTLSYEIPTRFLGSGKFVKRAAVSLVGRNLLMLRPSTNWWTDPEFANTTGNAIGVTDIGQAPPTRLFGFNVNVTF